ncbi:uncharacterized protein LOC126897499 isoform X2 [Daktulosphaira vitifoliae]|uniref:uncharacterized protein LOC126897499 isoform X2 n=1 Tax=Daktulosphaira vitifoliae TaxID=58002 RepID=UPI0021AAC35C|nr:uncharacterized protein LOC126897499 isoform X2 [Daktulosphaira vitifoliae]
MASATALSQPPPSHARGRRTRKLFAASALFSRWFRRRGTAGRQAAEDSAWFRDNLQLIRQAYAAEQNKPGYETVAYDRHRPPSMTGRSWCRRSARWSGSTTTVYSFDYFDAANARNNNINGDGEPVEYIDALAATTLPAGLHRRRKPPAKLPPSANDTAKRTATKPTVEMPPQTAVTDTNLISAVPSTTATIPGTTTGTRTRRKKYRAPPPPTTPVVPESATTSLKKRAHRKGPAPKPPDTAVATASRQVPKAEVQRTPKTIVGVTPQTSHTSTAVRGMAADEKDRLRRRVDKIEKRLTEKTPTGYGRPASAVYTEMAVTNITELDRRAAEICKSLSESTEAARRLSASLSVVVKKPDERNRPVSAFVLPSSREVGTTSEIRRNRVEFFERLKPLGNNDEIVSSPAVVETTTNVPKKVTKTSLGTQTTGRRPVNRSKAASTTKQNELAAEEKKSCYQELIAIENQNDLVTCDSQFECAVCLCVYKSDGIMLRDCLHVFCRPCLQMTIKHSDDEQVKCPYIDPQYSCTGVLQHREIKRILGTDDEYEKYLQKSVEKARQLLAKGGSFQCRRPDCSGWCLIDDKRLVLEFKCPVCGSITCVRCEKIHKPGQLCEKLQRKTTNLNFVSGESSSDIKAVVKDLVECGEAMECPGCNTIISKQKGCDWLLCTVCSTEICWATKGPRWGPKGKGDTSAGCQCGIPPGRRCHVSCNYCH